MTIDRDIEDVWAYITDLSAMDNWVVGVSNTTLKSGEDSSVGAVYAFDYDHNGGQVQREVEITEMDAPNRIAMKSLKGPFSYESEIILTEENGHTHAENIIEPGSDGLFTTVMFTVFKPVMRYVMKRRLKAELDELKAILETNDPEVPPPTTESEHTPTA